MTEYLNEFVQESEESITELNNALLELERNPDDEAAMDQVFRTAHTLKGNAGAMGFDRASDLAHAIEDLLDAVRAGSLEVEPSLMDQIFEGVDLLEQMVDEVAAHGDTQTDPSDVIDSLRGRIEADTGLTKPDDDDLVEVLADGERPKRQHQTFHARLSIAGEDAGGPVLDALDDAFDVLGCDPPESAVRAGDHPGVVDVAFGSAVDEAAIAAALKPVGAVEDAILTEVPDDVLERAGASEPEGDGLDEVGADIDDPTEMAVDDLLDEFDEYDDLDEAVERVDDVQGLENMGEAGAFEDIVEEDVDPSYADAESPDADGDATEEEPDDVQGTFAELQEEYDQVGLDEMEAELETVEFGEFDQNDEVGFDELLGEDVAAEPVDAGPEPEDESAEPVVEMPDESVIEDAIAAAGAPGTPDRRVFFVRLGIVDESGVNNGQRVVDALHDAFEVLGTQPPESAIGDGDYEDTVDVVFGSEVGEAQIEAALDPVDEVSDAAVVEVTDRVAIPVAEPSEADVEPAEADAEPAEADAEPAEADVEPAEADAEPAEADVEPAEAEPGPADSVPAAGEIDEEDLDAEVVEAEGEIEDAMSEFRQMQQAYDEVGLDEIEDELEGVSFGEYDQDEEVGFDELLGEETEPESEPEPEPAETEPEAEPEPADSKAEAEPTDTAVEAGSESESEPADAEPEPAIADPADETIEAALASAATRTDPDQGVYHVRVRIAGESGDSSGATTGQRVVDALDDAFEVLGTQPPESAIADGDYGNSVDAVFGSHVDEAEVEAALAPVDGVEESIITDVTDRAPEPEPGPSTAPSTDGTADAEGDAADAQAPREEPDDVQGTFAELQEEYDRVGLGEMEAELEDVSFGEYDQDEEVGFDELLGEEFDLESEAAEVGADAGTDTGAEDAADAAIESADAGGEAADEDVDTGMQFDEIEADDDLAAEADASEDLAAEADAGDETAAEADAGDETAADPEDAFARPEGELGGTADSETESLDEVEVEEFTVEEETFDDSELDATGADESDDSFADVDVGRSEFDPVEPDADAESVSDGEDASVEADADAGAEAGAGAPTEAGPEPDSVPEEDRRSAPVTEVKGIGEAYGEALGEAGVETVGDLVDADPGAVAAEADLSPARIGEWQSRAPAEPAEPATDAETTASVDAEATTGDGTETTADAAAEPATGTEREMDEIQSIRVDVDRVDDLLNLVEEMVTGRARLRRAIEEGADQDVLEDELDDLAVTTSELQDAVLEMRLIPMRTVSQRLPRVVRDIAREQDKSVRFEVEGEGVEVDRSILDQIGDPLIHLVRNAVDHGIEPPEQREAAGKDREGEVVLRARRARDTVVIEVEDDGRGLDPDDLRDAAVEEGVLTRDAADAMSDDEAYQLIFESGLSTREEVTEVSGRGVGMDVVASVVEELDGDVSVTSTPGEGTTVSMELPVTVAIAEVLFLQVGGEEYGVPISVVDEIGGMATVETLDGGERIRTADGREHDLIQLHEALNTPEPARTDGGGMVVTIEDDVRQAAIHCDRVRGQQEVVVKPFEGYLSGIPGLSGAAVLGEGDVVTILDVESL